MRHSLHAHIIYLENSIQDVKNRLTRPSLTPEEVEDLHLQLTLAESALEHYRQAYALELSFAGAEPPTSPEGCASQGGSEEARRAKGGKENGGVASVEADARKRITQRGRLRVSRQSTYARGKGRQSGLACA
jgi:hypothetical protein